MWCSSCSWKRIWGPFIVVPDLNNQSLRSGQFIWRTDIFWKLVLFPWSRTGDACPALNEDIISETWASWTWGGGRPLWRWNALQYVVRNDNNRSLAEEFRRGEGGELGLHYMLDWKHILQVSAQWSSFTVWRRFSLSLNMWAETDTKHLVLEENCSESFQMDLLTLPNHSRQRTA